MMTRDLTQWREFGARALLVGRHLDLRAIDPAHRTAVSPLAVDVGERGLAVLFRYGAAVVFNTQPVEQAAFLVGLNSVVGQRLERPEEETARLRVEPGSDERIDGSGVVRLGTVTMDRLLVVADVLAKSVSLAYDENRVGRVFDQTEPVAEAMRGAGGRRMSAQQLLDHIGDVLITQHRMVGRVEVTEKPELLWDRPELERFYLRLQEEFELSDRDRALTRKLDLISQTATTALGLIQTRRSLRVEWYIVILIVIEIFLTLYQMFGGLAGP